MGKRMASPWNIPGIGDYYRQPNGKWKLVIGFPFKIAESIQARSGRNSVDLEQDEYGLWCGVLEVEMPSDAVRFEVVVEKEKFEASINAIEMSAVVMHATEDEITEQTREFARDIYSRRMKEGYRSISDFREDLL